jgi:hypothetical protein
VVGAKGGLADLQRPLLLAAGAVQVALVSKHEAEVAVPGGHVGVVGAKGGLGEGRRMADSRRMTPQEQGEAHALLVKAASDPDRQAARQALDELMRKLLVCTGCWRPRSASPSASRRPTRRNGCRCASGRLGTLEAPLLDDHVSAHHGPAARTEGFEPGVPPL